MKTRDAASPVRCGWAKLQNPLYVTYHDREWGEPLYHDRRLFELLVLEGAQAGLSWETILNKRAAYRRAFDRFDPKKIAAYGRRDVARLMRDEGIVRNRLKIEAAIVNARVFLEVKREHRRFGDYLWSFVGGTPRQNAWRTLAEIPPRTAESDAMSKDLKRRGFKFVGSTICYAFMQATGMVNDHLVDCFRHPEVQRGRGARPAAAPRRPRRAG